jgi:hypothetical protein
MIRIGQDRLSRAMSRKGLRAETAPYYRRLDAFVTVSGTDARDYRAHLRLPHTRLAPAWSTWSPCTLSKTDVRFVEVVTVRVSVT